VTAKRVHLVSGSPDRRIAAAGLIDGSLNCPRGLEMKALQQFRQGI